MRATVLLISGCLVLACARPDYVDLWPDRFLLPAEPQLGYAIKRVVGRLSPATLVGDDGSVCRTYVHRFAATTVGSWINCNWTLPSIDSTEFAQAGA